MKEERIDFNLVFQKEKKVKANPEEVLRVKEGKKSADADLMALNILYLYTF